MSKNSIYTSHKNEHSILECPEQVTTNKPTNQPKLHLLLKTQPYGLFYSRHMYSVGYIYAYYIFGNLYSPSKMVARYNIKQNKTVKILK